MNTEKRKYPMSREIIKFTDTITNRNQPRRGFRIGNYLATGGKGLYRIYNFRTGKPVLPVRFSSTDKAVKVAEWLDEIYGEYFPIWDNPGWEGVNLFSLLRYTIPNGEAHYETIRRLK